MAQMGEWMGDCLDTPMTEIQTLAQFMADDAARAPQDEALDIPPHEMERIVHDMLTRQYTKTLDEPVPALGHKTPRALARTKAGRVKVADWPKYIENGAGNAGAGHPMASSSEERRVGTERVRTCRPPWWPPHPKKKTPRPPKS